MKKFLKIGDDPELRKKILQDGQEALGGTSPDCPHRVLADEGSQELTPSMEIKYPGGVRLGTCKNCLTTKGVILFHPSQWPQF